MNKEPNEAQRAPMLIYPGEVGELVDLNDFLCERHEEIRAARARLADEAATNGTPFEDPPIAPYVREVKCEGIEVQFVILEERRRRALAVAEGKAWTKVKAARDADVDIETIAAATDALFDAYGARVRESVVQVRAGEVVVEPALLTDVLERNGLLQVVAQAAAAFQELSPGKVRRSGSQAASTSGASSARSALSFAEQYAAATAARSRAASPPSSPALDGQPMSAPGGT